MLLKKSLSFIRYLKRNLNRFLEILIYNILLNNNLNKLDRLFLLIFILLNFNKLFCILIITIIFIFSFLNKDLKKKLKINLYKLID